MQKLIPIVKSKSRVDIPDLCLAKPSPYRRTIRAAPSYVISSSKKQNKEKLEEA
jgi:hypothetical protein